MRLNIVNLKNSNTNHFQSSITLSKADPNAQEIHENHLNFSIHRLTWPIERLSWELIV